MTDDIYLDSEQWSLKERSLESVKMSDGSNRESPLNSRYVDRNTLRLFDFDQFNPNENRLAM